VFVPVDLSPIRAGVGAPLRLLVVAFPLRDGALSHPATFMVDGGNMHRSLGVEV